MGAQQFTATAKGKTPQEAFLAAREEAAYENGHGGYTGTIAEKYDFKVVTKPKDMKFRDFVHKLIDDEHSPFLDKWGPAACLKTGEDEYTFFGWASS